MSSLSLSLYFRSETDSRESSEMDLESNVVEETQEHKDKENRKNSKASKTDKDRKKRKRKHREMEEAKEDRLVDEKT